MQAWRKDTEEDELHVLHLKKRRSNLWKLPLTCENGNQLIPYLDIINEVLENFIAVSLGFEERRLPAPGASDRSPVENKVYQALQNTTASFSLRISLPLERLALYLSHFDLKRGDIAAVLGLPDRIRAAAKLRLLKLSITEESESSDNY